MRNSSWKGGGKIHLQEKKNNPSSSFYSNGDGGQRWPFLSFFFFLLHLFLSSVFVLVQLQKQKVTKPQRFI
jgi:hypothetical protein